MDSYELREKIAQKIPIWGVLLTTDRSAQLEALYELVLTVIFSTMPIWLLGLLSAIQTYVSIDDSQRSLDYFWDAYLSSMRGAISNAEMLMYVAAMLGPTFYLGLSSFRQGQAPYPWVRLQIIVAVLTGLIATALFIVFRDTERTDDPFIVSSSLILYAFSLAILFPTMAQNHARYGYFPAAEQSRQTDEFTREYERHRTEEQ